MWNITPFIKQGSETIYITISHHQRGYTSNQNHYFSLNFGFGFHPPMDFYAEIILCCNAIRGFGFISKLRIKQSSGLIRRGGGTHFFLYEITKTELYWISTLPLHVSTKKKKHFHFMGDWPIASITSFHSIHL